MDKQCSRCGEIKDVSDFYKHNKMLEKRHNICKACDRITSKENYEKNIEDRREKRKKWIENNREKHNAAVLRYYYKKKLKGE